MEQTVLIGGIYQMFRNEETSDYFVVIAEGTVAYLGFDVFETRTDGISNANVVHSIQTQILRSQDFFSWTKDSLQGNIDGYLGQIGNENLKKLQTFAQKCGWEI